MDVANDKGFRRSPFWLLVLLILMATQGWLTLRLFGPGLPINRLTNDEPILDGRYPLHAYHGLLGNRAWHEWGVTTCFDPAFQAGYPKTPIFDAGSRPAELFYLIGGPTPRSFKVGLLICCLVVPLAFALAGRGVGLGAGGCCLAGLIGGVLWWSPPCRALLANGDLDLLVGGMAIPIYVTWLGRFWRDPGPLEWLVVAGSAALGWYMQPLLMLGAVPISILFNLWAFRGVRFVWHLGLASANLGAIAANSFWLWDWAVHLWMYVPYGGEDSARVLWPATAQEWEAFLPSDPVELAVFAIGLVGVLAMCRRNAVGAFLLTVAAMLYVLAGGAGRLWPVVAEVGAQKLMSVGVWCCAVPAAYALTSLAGGMGSTTGIRLFGPLWLVIGLAGLMFGLDVPRRWDVKPLTIGLGPDRAEIVRQIRERSTADGRILWEDSETTQDGGWSAMLPELTQRPFLGGLTTDVTIDHLHAQLANGKLMGRSVEEWTDDELARFLVRYNVTRVVCRTPESTARVRRLPGAVEVARFKEDVGVMFAIDRRPNYILSGRGAVTQMDWRRVALADLEPDENGVVVLSLHHHANWHVTPGYVLVEKDVDVNDPIPMVRLRLPGPVSRVTMVWKGD
jgi:hypothetical protein